MSIALQSGLIILIMLVIMLIAGVPIAVALGVSSVCAILPIMNVDVAVLTGCQRIFSILEAETPVIFSLAFSRVSPCSSRHS